MSDATKQSERLRRIAVRMRHWNYADLPKWFTDTANDFDQLADQFDAMALAAHNLLENCANDWNSPGNYLLPKRWYDELQAAAHATTKPEEPT